MSHMSEPGVSAPSSTDSEATDNGTLSEAAAVAGSATHPAKLTAQVEAEGAADPLDAELPEGRFRSEEHTSELQSRGHLVCRLLLEKKKTNKSEKHKYCK